MPSPVALVVVNARVRTGDSVRPWADALAVGDECLLVVGSSAAVRKLAGPATPLIDARGATVIPAPGVARLIAGGPADFDVLFAPGDVLPPRVDAPPAPDAAAAPGPAMPHPPVRLRVRAGRPVSSGT